MNDKDIVTPFKKSSYSGGGQTECVEVAGTRDGGRAVRDSKDPCGPVLSFPADAWAAFVSDVQDGAYPTL